MNRIIIVSNRLPFSIVKTGDEIGVRQSSGGLVSAIKSYFDAKDHEPDHTEKIWIGSMDAEEVDWIKGKEIGLFDADFKIVPIFPQKQDYDNFYNGFANSVLWPLFHYFPSLVEIKQNYYEAYEQINRLFVEAVIKEYREGDVIWVHDYQLMMLPDLLREKLPTATIGFFLHIPFPSYELFRILPTKWKQSLLKGMLGADLIGFHTHDYVQHFIHSAKMILQAESQFNNILFNNRLIKADLFPIGIDYKKFRDACIDESVIEISTALEERFYNLKIIFSVDRLDYTKGLEYRLASYETFLQQNPKWREKVVFILNIVPSRDSIQTYSERKRLIEEKVSMINGKFSSLHWQPLIYRYNHVSFEELCALYQVADVALITPLRDGMNLVAKEYIASCIDKGVLILSELTGASNELSEALLVNPTDVQEVSEAINSALEMPLVEQRSRLSYMQHRIAEYDVIKWINDFLDRLRDAKKEQEALKANVIHENTIEEIVADFNSKNKRCILLDYDGTLAPYQKLPSLAAPSNELIDLLKEITKDDATELIIISGRDAVTLEKWLGHLPLHLVAEHGAMVRYKNEEWKETVTVSTEWKDEIRPLMELFVERCAGSFIEEKKSTLAWHYRNTYPELGFNRSRELRNSLLQLTANTSLQVIDGNKVLEVRTVGLDKGATATNMLATINPDFILCMGDDATDEDMFKILRDKGYTIKIGRGSTAAQYTIVSQKEVFPFLRRFLQPIQSKQFNYS